MPSVHYLSLFNPFKGHRAAGMGYMIMAKINITNILLNIEITNRCVTLFAALHWVQDRGLCVPFLFSMSLSQFHLL